MVRDSGLLDEAFVQTLGYQWIAAVEVLAQVGIIVLRVVR
jgi:hypothetical protein